jgi:hypothetical protein
MGNGNVVKDFFNSVDRLRLDVVEEHAHSKGFVLPQDDSPITLATTNSAWSDLSNMITEIASAGHMSTLIGTTLGNKSFDLHWAVISDPDGNGDYELAIYQGAAGSEVEMDRVPFTRSGAQLANVNSPIITTRCDKATRISAALQSDQGAVRTVNLKLKGHSYDDPA